MSKRGRPYRTRTDDTWHLCLVVGTDTLLTPSRLPECMQVVWMRVKVYMHVLPVVEVKFACMQTFVIVKVRVRPPALSLSIVSGLPALSSSNLGSGLPAMSLSKLGSGLTLVIDIVNACIVIVQVWDRPTCRHWA